MADTFFEVTLGSVLGLGTTGDRSTRGAHSTGWAAKGGEGLRCFHLSTLKRFGQEISHSSLPQRGTRPHRPLPTV